MFAPNLCAVVYGPHDLRLEERPIPKIKDNEVLLQMNSVGICGSDVKMTDTGRCGPYGVDNPIITGHEGAGTVIKVGSAVRGLLVGDRVAVEPNVPCAHCERCRSGRYNLCATLRTCAMPPYDGNLAVYYAHDADFCHKLPSTMSMDEGAILQPLTIAVHACERARVSLGARVLVIGAGSIGILTMKTARAMGASTIVITDIIESRVEKARLLGADHAVLVKADEPERAVLARCGELLGSRPDIAFECVGSDTTFRQAFLAPRDGGIAMIVGIVNTMTLLPLSETMLREVDVLGTVRFANKYTRALSMVEKGIIDIKSLISHHYGLDQLAEAFDAARHRKGLKIILHPYSENNNNTD